MGENGLARGASPNDGDKDGCPTMMAGARSQPERAGPRDAVERLSLAENHQVVTNNAVSRIPSTTTVVVDQAANR